ncbi:MAG TPA: hypothetical protein VMU05_02535 [Dongiaceae bacterium]|nr:hypothetical protein [Dongiaceae bacterium]
MLNVRFFVFVTCLLWSISGFSQQCGISGDTKIHIPANYDSFVPPALGKSYTDATFGCQITRLTDSVHNPGSQSCSAGKCQGRHFYSTVVPDNVDHTLVAITLNGLPAVIAGPVTTYASPGTIIVKQNNFPTHNLTSQDFVLWDLVDPATFYYTAGNTFVMGKISGLPGCAATSSCTIKSTVLKTFTGYSSVSLLADEDISEDGLHYYLAGQRVGMITDSSCDAVSQLCDLFPITLNASGGKATTVTQGKNTLSTVYWHKVQAAATDNRVQLEAVDGGKTFTEYNPNGTVFATLFTTHHDFLHNSANQTEAMVGTWSVGTSANVCPHLNGAGEIDTASGVMLNCLLEVFVPGTSTYGVPPGFAPASHFSTRDASQGWAIFEAESYAPGACPNSANPYCEPGAGAATNMRYWGLYDGEIDAIKADGSQFRRLAHHRSRSGAGYWAGSRAVITRDAQYIYFDSNFDSCTQTCGSQTRTDNQNYTDLYVIKFSTAQP